MDKNELDEIAKGYDGLHDEWLDLLKLVRENEFRVFLQYAQGRNSVAEIGLGNGVFTKLLSTQFEKVIAIDASFEAIEYVKKELKNHHNVQYIEAFVEQLRSIDTVDNVVMSHLLEHLDDPISALMHLKTIINEKSTVYISVPNAFSLHRQVAVKMGLLPTIDSLNNTDLKLGHKRVYTPTLLREHVLRSGFFIIKFGGSMIKPLTNKQIQDSWDKKMIEGFIALGNDYPELCGDIYIIAKRI